MVILLIVVAAIVVLALALGVGGYGFGGGEPVVRRTIYRRRPVRRVVTEHRVVDDPAYGTDPVYDDPVYRP